MPSQGGDIRLGLNEGGGQMPGLNPNWHHIWVFGQFDQVWRLNSWVVAFIISYTNQNNRLLYICYSS